MEEGNGMRVHCIQSSRASCVAPHLIVCFLYLAISWRIAFEIAAAFESIGLQGIAFHHSPSSCACPCADRPSVPDFRRRRRSEGTARIAPRARSVIAARL
jgi:hypothetical protein